MRTAINSEVFTFSFGALPKDEPHFYVASFTGTEALNSLFQFDIVLLCTDVNLDTRALVGTNATFTIRRAGSEDAVFPGYVSKIEMTGLINGYCYYIVSLCPKFAKFKLMLDSAVFLDKDLKETIDIILEKDKFFTVEHEFRFADTYPKKEFALQFEENSFEYILWRLEEQGAYFYFDKNGERVIFSDNPRLHDASQGTVYYTPGTGLEINIEEEVVHSFELKQTILPARVVVRTYDQKNPNVPLVGIAEVSKTGLSDVYLPDEAADSQGEADRIARIRAEQILAGGRIFKGKSSVPFFRPGVVFTLTRHNKEKFNRDYVITRITHEGKQETLLNFVCKIPIQSGDNNLFYRNSFECIESGIKYRSSRTVRRESIYGGIHAVIDGDGTGKALIDNYGRYKVLFPFDISGRSSGNSSCWIRRAQEQVGKDCGMAFPLKPGTEVLVIFLDGNPDKPIISGALANGETGSISGDGNSDFLGVRTESGAQFTLGNKKNLIQLTNPAGGEIMFASGSQDYMRTNTHIGLETASVGSSSIAGAAADSITGFISRAYTECGNKFLYFMGILSAAAKTGQSAFEGLSEKGADPNLKLPDWGGTITKIIPFIRAISEFLPYNAVISASQKNASSTLQCFPGKAELIANFVVMAGARLGSMISEQQEVKKGEEKTKNDSKYDAYPKEAAVRQKKAVQLASCLPELAIIILMLYWRKKLSAKHIGGIMINAKDKNINLFAKTYIGFHAERGIFLNASEMKKKDYIDWGSPWGARLGESVADPNISDCFKDILDEKTWGGKTVKDRLLKGHVNRKAGGIMQNIIATASIPSGGLMLNKQGFIAQTGIASGTVKEGILSSTMGSGPAEPLEDDNTFIIGKTNFYYMQSMAAFQITSSMSGDSQWVSYSPIHEFSTEEGMKIIHLDKANFIITDKKMLSLISHATKLDKEGKIVEEDQTYKKASMLLVKPNLFKLGGTDDGTGLTIDSDIVSLSYGNELEKTVDLALSANAAKLSNQKDAYFTLGDKKIEIKAETVNIGAIGFAKKIFSKKGVLWFGNSLLKITSN